MFGSLLSGATGALGFGGDVGSSTDPGQSSQSSLQQTLTTSTDVKSGSGSRGAINIAFPGASLSTKEDINPTLESSPTKLALIAGGFVLVLILTVTLIKR